MMHCSQCSFRTVGCSQYTSMGAVRPFIYPMVYSLEFPIVHRLVPNYVPKST